MGTWLGQWCDSVPFFVIRYGTRYLAKIVPRFHYSYLRLEDNSVLYGTRYGTLILDTFSLLRSFCRYSCLQERHKTSFSSFCDCFSKVVAKEVFENFQSKISFLLAWANLISWLSHSQKLMPLLIIQFSSNKVPPLLNMVFPNFRQTEIFLLALKGDAWA